MWGVKVKKFKKYLLSFLTTIIIGISLFFNYPSLMLDGIADKHTLYVANEYIYLHYLNDQDTLIDSIKE